MIVTLVPTMQLMMMLAMMMMLPRRFCMRAALQAAHDLCAQCFAPLVKQRPLFKTIEERLASLTKQLLFC